MKEKKMVLSVILGVSLVALITALVAGLADCLSLLIDGSGIKDLTYHENYHHLVGGLEVGAVALGIAFAAVFIFAKGEGKKVSTIVLAAVLAGYLVITAIVLRIVAPASTVTSIFGKKSRGDLYAVDYTLFMSYITTVITITVSTVLACVSSLLLGRAKKAEETKQPDREISVDKTEE